MTECTSLCDLKLEKKELWGSQVHSFTGMLLWDRKAFLTKTLTFTHTFNKKICLSTTIPKGSVRFFSAKFLLFKISSQSFHLTILTIVFPSDLRDVNSKFWLFFRIVRYKLRIAGYKVQFEEEKRTICSQKCEVISHNSDFTCNCVL